MQSSEFQNDLSELLIYDQQEFDEPQGWQTKVVKDSPLLTDFSALWANLRSTYQNELTPLAFSEIPNETLIEKSFMEIIKETIKMN